MIREGSGNPTSSLSSSTIKTKARAVGFDLVGVSRAERHPRLARLADWIESGQAGEMSYLERTLAERSDPAEVLTSARSVVSLAVVYNTGRPNAVAPTTGDGPDAEGQDEASRRVTIARYARGDDYHDVLRARLRALLVWMADAAGSGFEAFSCVDTGPVQERVFAEQAGLGWIGKNTLLINPDLGSWVFLAEIITNLDLEPDTPGVDQCGTCTRCLDACPTDAFVAPYTLDATRCLSYLTIEVRGAVAPALRPEVGAQVFGCDICQDVCPWNGRAATSDDPAWRTRPGLEAPRLIDLCRMPDVAWRRLIHGSALRRAGLKRIRRSLAYAAASLPDAEREAALGALGSHPSAQDEPAAGAISWAREAGRRAAGTGQRDGADGGGG